MEISFSIYGEYASLSLSANVYIDHLMVVHFMNDAWYWSVHMNNW